MSQWTHVSGIIRYDDLRVVVGKVTGVSQRPTPPLGAVSVPSGSEGSLSIRELFSEEPYEYQIAIAAWGDLRDFGESDIHRVKAWLDTAAILPDGMLIRSAVIEAQVEYGATHIWNWIEGAWVETIIAPAEAQSEEEADV